MTVIAEVQISLTLRQPTADLDSLERFWARVGRGYLRQVCRKEFNARSVRVEIVRIREYGT